MARKRKTLQKNFNELIEVGDIVALQEVCTKCEFEAYGGYSKTTALSFSKYRMNWFAGSWNKGRI